LLTSFLEEEPTNGQQQGSSHSHNSNTEIQQLLTYALIHPALSLENKKYFQNSIFSKLFF